MKELLLVATGGGLGACARYLLSGYVLQFAAQSRFPWGTFTVNVLGCLVAGLLMALAEKYQLISPAARLFLFTGILGGFTTFSAFGVETVNLIRRGDILLALAYVLASVVCGLAVLWLAYLAFPGRRL
jgi:CrcB protein